ncbi:hypothetical protein V5O48_018064, partial [Marasmius crinis-equi]
HEDLAIQRGNGAHPRTIRKGLRPRIRAISPLPHQQAGGQLPPILLHRPRWHQEGTHQEGPDEEVQRDLDCEGIRQVYGPLSAHRRDHNLPRGGHQPEHYQGIGQMEVRRLPPLLEARRQGQLHTPHRFRTQGARSGQEDHSL